MSNKLLTITVDIDKMMMDLLEYMSKKLDVIAMTIMSEMQHNPAGRIFDIGIYDKNKAADDFQIIPAEVQAFEKRAVAYIEAGALAIMDSFGTGDRRDKSNKQWGDYKESEYFNKLRSGNTIVGREGGTYKSIFGSAVSSGTHAGVPIGSPGITPTMRIQDVEKIYFDDGELADYISKEFTEWLSKNATKYWGNA